MLHPQQLDAYRREGYAICGRLLHDGALAQLRRAMDARIAALPPGQRPENMPSLHYDDAYFRDLFLSPAFVDVAEQILGPDLALFTSYAISKRPGDGLPVAWHQDAAFFPIEPMATFTLWLAVDESTRENGAMQVMAGSHRDGRILHHDIDQGGGSVLPLHLGGFKPEQVRDVEVAAGCYSVHDPYILHGSPPNRSSSRRCGITIKYVSTGIRLDRGFVSPTGFDWHGVRLYHARGARGRLDYVN
ncbi:MAG: phytanoyl-CoA dioxygenase family protein [Alphaproteobacteria bacterium]|nr:phytanoyl-CoA dioxygenase family protein [Alphaproteobacteria bacterium]